MLMHTCLRLYALDIAAGADVCTSQESSLALLWTLGIFTLNCGPVAMGFVLDLMGPKLTGILGACHWVVWAVASTCCSHNAGMPCAIVCAAASCL